MRIKSINKIVYSEPKQYYDVINANPYNNFLVKTNDSCIVSHNCLASFFDEISFIPTQDIEKQKERAKDMIDTAIGGMKTRFTQNGKNPGMIILASSKRSEKSFLEEHMKRKIENDHDNVLIVDEAVWNVKPKGTYSDKTFKIAVGNKFLNSQIIKDGENEDFYTSQGYRILNVPSDLRAEFMDDIDRALCDFAGISSSDLSTYISGVRWEQCKCKDVENPFTKDIIEVGNSFDDKQQYSDYFNLNKVPIELKGKPLFIHLDMSISGDKTGIAGTWIYGKKPTEAGKDLSKDLYFQPAFSVSVKAPKGYQVSFEKNRNFIRWLKQNGFAIKLVSCDTFQSYDLLQQLKSEGYNTEILSVDRVDSDRICKPYQYLRSAIYEQRIRLFNKCDLLTKEAISLVRNNNTGKVDHEESGSKDQIDALCGSVFEASKYAEQYSFDYGDDIESTLEATLSDANESSKQITIDFENELKRAMSNKVIDAKELDFGFGPSIPMANETGALISEGLMIW